MHPFLLRHKLNPPPPPTLKPSLAHHTCDRPGTKMAKQQLMLMASLALLLLQVSASSYRTTVVINEDTAPERREQPQRTAEGCQGRVQAQQLQSCKQYLRGASGKGSQGYIVLPARRREGGGGQQGQQEQQKRQQQQQQLQQCCQQLKQVEDKCRCEALKEIVREQQQRQPAQQPSQPGQIQQRASALPVACGLGSQRCQFGTGSAVHPTVFW
ncbi:hypothetical protein MLD38_022051 [Melastoma candidum]|uniref:Uncharacterized protein n=1 Tax=Melastoma candidum TaxID=119954 RepID=A0ACB9QHC7_9MYRT|nr:hypothetical protein MLD38_022051 [Melastoma candidum]